MAEILTDGRRLDEEEVKTYIREVIEAVFELDPKDIVLFLRNKIYIRLYTPPKAVPQGQERRYAGEDPDEMERMFNALFPDGLLEEIEEYLPEILDEQLNFTLIDNVTFNKNYIQVFRSMVDILLVETVENMPMDKLEGFTGYVLRQYFDEILVYTARELLYYVEERNKNAEAFIKYYKDEIIIDADGRKIQKHAIIDAKKQTWNYSAILSVLMQYAQAKKRLEQQDTKIANIERRIEEIKGEVAYERQEKQSAEEHVNKLNEHLTLKKAQMHRRESAGEKNALWHAQVSKEHSELLDELKISREEALFAGRRYQNKLTELDNWKKQLVAHESQMKEIRQQNANIVEMINLIVDALAVVFSKR